MTTTMIESVPFAPFRQVISPAPREVWRKLVQADANALVTQTPDWIDGMCDGGAYRDASTLYEMHDGRFLLLPLVGRALPLAGHVLPRRFQVLSSMPESWGMGGLLSDKPIVSEDVTHILHDLSRRATAVRLRPNPLTTQLWEEAAPASVLRIPRLGHVIDLSQGFDAVWNKGFSSSKRRNVRKAERLNVTVECDTTGRLVPVFYELFQRSLQRWAQQQHEPRLLARLRGQRRDPLQKFEQLAKRMGSAMQIWVAWHEGTAVAAIVVLQGANAHYTRGAMDKELANPVRANDLLHRLAIEDACQAGCRTYHMGETGESESLARYKEGLGAQPVRYAELRLERLPITKVDNALKGLVKKAIGFQDV